MSGGIERGQRQRQRPEDQDQQDDDEQQRQLLAPSPPVLPDAFCWSTAAAMSPARCTCSPAGSPALAILRAQRVHQVELRRPGCPRSACDASTTQLLGLPVRGDRQRPAPC